jgi:hypothetical protein
MTQRKSTPTAPKANTSSPTATADSPAPYNPEYVALDAMLQVLREREEEHERKRRAQESEKQKPK